MIIAFLAPVRAQQIELVSEIFPQADFAVCEQFRYGGEQYFTTFSAKRLITIWKITGTGVERVKDWYTCRAADAYTPLRPVEHNGLLWFCGCDQKLGVEPWISDGTAQGTAMLRDLMPGGLWSVAPDDEIFHKHDGKLYFKGFRFFRNVSSGALWQTGDYHDSYQTLDFGNTVTEGYGVLHLLPPVKNELWFIGGHDESDLGLYKTDSTHANIIPLVTPLPGWYPRKWRDRVLFHSGFGPVTVSDGTPAGTYEVPGSEPYTSDFVELGNSVYYITAEGWLCALEGDPARFRIVHTLQPGSRSAEMTHPDNFRQWSLSVHNGGLYACGNNGVYRSDGTTAGTKLLANLPPFGGGHRLPGPIATAAGKLYVHAIDSGRIELFEIDGNSARRIDYPGATAVEPEYENLRQDYTLADPMMVHAGSLYFTARYTATAGKALYRIRLENTGSPATANAVDMKLFPVPATDHLFVEVSAPTALISAAVTDITGRIVLELKLEPKQRSRIDLRSIPPGAYSLTVATSSGTMSRGFILCR